MLQSLTDLPDGVLGFEARGEIEADDYRNVLSPAIERVVDSGHDIRMVIVFTEWDGMSGGALWQDLKMGAGHLRHWKRIALVTDIDWMARAAKLFGWMTPGEMRVFPIAERDAAIAWTAATD
jgi:SpoIIAA-like